MERSDETTPLMEMVLKTRENPEMYGKIKEYLEKNPEQLDRKNIYGETDLTLAISN